MDPNAALKEFIDLITGKRLQIGDLDRVWELADALIGWRASGGFAPTDPRKES